MKIGNAITPVKRHDSPDEIARGAVRGVRGHFITEAREPMPALDRI